MNIRYKILIILFLVPLISAGMQDQSLNQTDREGRKQGHWIKKYPDGKIMYDGFFKNDKPEGTFKRFYENGVLKSAMTFLSGGTVAEGTLYFGDGLIASQGKYVNKLKEGTWFFYSPTSKGQIIMKEEYAGDRRNGISVKYYPDSTVAEKITYENDSKEGPWMKYYPSGKISLSANCSRNRLNGKYEGFFENGNTEISGNYKDDLRDGPWTIFNKDGKERFRIDYVLGIPKTSDLDIYETNYLDSLEKSKPAFPDPEKTGQIW
jgi:antitoxin component YwqK of YwqJK toxin-antitoxin module